MVTWTVDEADGPQEFCLALAIRTNLARRRIGRRITRGTLVERSVSIPDTDGNSSTELFRVPSSPDPRERLDNGALSIVDMSQGSNVNFRLHPKVTTLLFSFRTNRFSWKLPVYPPR